MPVYMSGKEDIWEKACQITTRRGLKADSHCVGIREAEEALAHIRGLDTDRNWHARVVEALYHTRYVQDKPIGKAAPDFKRS